MFGKCYVFNVKAAAAAKKAILKQIYMKYLYLKTGNKMVVVASENEIPELFRCASLLTRVTCDSRTATHF